MVKQNLIEVLWLLFSSGLVKGILWKYFEESQSILQIQQIKQKRNNREQNKVKRKLWKYIFKMKPYFAIEIIEKKSK